MENKKEMLLAVDLFAYCTGSLPADTDMSEDSLKNIAMQALDNGDQYCFDPDWSTAEGLRIVSAKQGDDVVTEGVSVQPCYYNVGNEFVSWLNGSQRLGNAIMASEGLLNCQDVGLIEHQHGNLKLPGTAAIEVDFECRKGATREEKDLAFFTALADLGRVDYLCIGQSQPNHDQN